VLNKLSKTASLHFPRPALHHSKHLIGFARFAEVVLGIPGGEQLHHHLLHTSCANAVVASDAIHCTTSLATPTL